MNRYHDKNMNVNVELLPNENDKLLNGSVIFSNPLLADNLRKKNKRLLELLLGSEIEIQPIIGEFKGTSLQLQFNKCRAINDANMLLLDVNGDMINSDGSGIIFVNSQGLPSGSNNCYLKDSIRALNLIETYDKNDIANELGRKKANDFTVQLQEILNSENLLLSCSSYAKMNDKASSFRSVIANIDYYKDKIIRDCGSNLYKVEVASKVFKSLKCVLKERQTMLAKRNALVVESILQLHDVSKYPLPFEIAMKHAEKFSLEDMILYQDYTSEQYVELITSGRLRSTELSNEGLETLSQCMYSDEQKNLLCTIVDTVKRQENIIEECNNNRYISFADNCKHNCKTNFYYDYNKTLVGYNLTHETFKEILKQSGQYNDDSYAGWNDWYMLVPTDIYDVYIVIERNIVDYSKFVVHVCADTVEWDDEEVPEYGFDGFAEDVISYDKLVELLGDSEESFIYSINDYCSAKIKELNNRYNNDMYDRFEFIPNNENSVNDGFVDDYLSEDDINDCIQL